MRTSSGARTALILGSAMFVAVPATTLVQPSGLPPGMSRSSNPEAVEQRNSSAVAVILGEFRTNLSDLIFIKTERYLDSGVAYAPHIDTNELAKSGDTIQTGEERHEHEPASQADVKNTSITLANEDRFTSLDKHLASTEMTEAAGIKPGATKSEEPEKPVATIIKTADRDFRGFIGNLERSVKPWRDPREGHKHTAGTELLPWYRLATYSDPNNVRMYMIGAWWLKTLKNRTQVEEALKFLDEGVRHNPNAFQLHLMRGYILRQLQRDKEAKAAFHTATINGLKLRPADGVTSSSSKWDENMEEQLQGAMIMDVLYARDTESTQSALAKATEYAAHLNPPNPVQRLRSELQNAVSSK